MKYLIKIYYDSNNFLSLTVKKFQPTAANDELMLCTKKLLQLLAMSQLIPPPLANLHTIIEHFEAPEVSLVQLDNSILICYFNL